MESYITAEQLDNRLEMFESNLMDKFDNINNKIQELNKKIDDMPESKQAEMLQDIDNLKDSVANIYTEVKSLQVTLEDIDSIEIPDFRED